MKDKTVRIVCDDKGQHKVVERLFLKSGYNVLTEGKSRALLGMYYLSEPSVPESWPEFSKATNALYPFVWMPGPRTANGMYETSCRSAYGCFFLEEYEDKADDLARHLLQAAEDTLALAQLMGNGNNGSAIATPQWISTLLNKLPVGVQVLDRRFCSWYRNERHRSLVPTLNNSNICWMECHGDIERALPCDRCPTEALYNGTPSPTPVHRAVRFRNPRNDADPRLTKLDIIPLCSDNRVVGAVELVTDITDEVFQPGRPDFQTVIQGLLEAAFLGPFTRARLFLVSPDGKELKGHTAVGKPEPKCHISSMKIPVNPESPVGGTRITLPRIPQIRDGKTVHESERQYWDELDKDRAQKWADLPILDTNGEPVGKVVVDRWSKDGDEHPRDLELSDVDAYEGVLSLMARLINRARAFRTLADREALAKGVESLLQCHSSDKALEELCRCTSRLSGVVSSLVRFPEETPSGIRLKKAFGHGPYHKYCQESIPVQGTLAGEAFMTRRPTKVSHTHEKSLLLKTPRSAIRSTADKEALKRIDYQLSVPIGLPSMDPLAILCVLFEDPERYVDNTISILASVTGTALAVGGLSRDMRDCLLQVLELYDIDTSQHSRRVGRIAREIAKAEKFRGRLDPERAYLAGCLHDIGKVGLSNNIIRGYTRLTAGELAYVRAHVELGRDVLASMPQLQDVCRAAWEHHMWYNGERGYPTPQTKEDKQAWSKNISLLGRIVAVADCFEAMTSAGRYYQRPKSDRAALHDILNASGTQFSPEVVEAFEAVFGDIILALDEDGSSSIQAQSETQQKKQ